MRTVAYAAYHDSLLAGLAVSGVREVLGGGRRAAVPRVPGGARGGLGPGRQPAAGHGAAARPSRLRLHGGAPLVSPARRCSPLLQGGD